MTEQVLIEFITDDENLKSTADRLLALGKIDQQSAQMFKATNDQLKAREGITGKIVAATTKEQAVVDKLVLSLKNLSGESKKSVENLLKLSTDEISAGFDEAGISVDDYIAKLNKAGGSAGDFKPVNDQLKTQDALFNKVSASATKEQDVIRKLGAAFFNLTGEAKKSVASLLKLPTEEIIAGFEQSGMSVDEYIVSLQKVEGATEGANSSNVKLTTQLRAMREELVKMELTGQTNTEEFQKLSLEAAKLESAIGNVSKATKRLGSDTAVFDGLISGVQGLAGGFAVVQGAAALFGDESEEVQEVLLRVNAAMAILQGLQQIQDVLQKQSALSLLVLNIQRKVSNAQLTIETALQSRSVVVRGLATAAQWALNAAMAANPIGIVVVALVALVGAIAFFVSRSDAAVKSMKQLNIEFENSLEISQRYGEAIVKRGELLVAQAELEKKSAKEIRGIRAATQQDQLKLIEETRSKNEQAYNQARDLQRKSALEGIKLKDDEQEAMEKTIQNFEDLDKKRFDLTHEIDLKILEDRKATNEEILQDAISTQQAILDTILSEGGKNTAKDFQAQRDLLRAQAAFEVNQANEDAAKIFAIKAKLSKDLKTVVREERVQIRQETLAQLNTELIDEQKRSQAINSRTSQEEINIKKKIIIETARIESEQEGVLANKRLEIRKNALLEITNLQRDFNKQSTRETLEDYISVNNAQLQNINLTEHEKLDLRIDNIIAAASIEEEQNVGLSSKIKEINAKRDADIKAARLQSIQETLDKELKAFETSFAQRDREIENIVSGQDELRGAANGKERKRLEELLGIKKISLNEEFALIDEQSQHALDGIKMQKDALLASFKVGAKSRDEYNQGLAVLVDEEFKVVEEGEKKKRKSKSATLEHERQLDKERIQLAIEIASQLSGVLSNLSDLQTARESKKIEEQRQKINDLRAAGAITEKDAVERLKKVDQEERKIKYQAAVRDKQLAIFNAVIATAAGIAKASPVIPLMVLAGALGAAQIAIIAARPIPKFAKGKKDKYEGLGQVGEAGSELIESRGQMYVTKKPTIVWIGKADKIYNPKETKEIINRIMPTVNHHQVVMNGKEQKQVPIDYERLGKEIGKNTSMSLNIDGYKEFIKEQQSFITYLNSRRGF